MKAYLEFVSCFHGKILKGIPAMDSVSADRIVCYANMFVPSIRVCHCHELLFVTVVTYLWPPQYDYCIGLLDSIAAYVGYWVNSGQVGGWIGQWIGLSLGLVFKLTALVLGLALRLRSYTHQLSVTYPPSSPTSAARHVHNCKSKKVPQIRISARSPPVDTVRMYSCTLPKNCALKVPAQPLTAK